jgi:hypothetical protein
MLFEAGILKSPNATVQVPLKAGAQRTLEGDACKPFAG